MDFGIGVINTDSLIRLGIGLIVTIVLIFCYLKIRIPMLTIVVFIIAIIIDVQLLLDGDMLFYPWLQLLFILIDSFLFINTCWKVKST